MGEGRGADGMDKEDCLANNDWYLASGIDVEEKLLFHLRNMHGLC